MNWLFNDFLTNPAVYQEAQRYWERIVQNALSHIFNGTKIEVKNAANDGNPIYSAVCNSLQLAVRVIQYPIGESDDLPLDFWVDSITIEPGVVIKELVIACCLSEEIEPDVKRLLRDWFTKGKVITRQNPHDAQSRRNRALTFSNPLCF